MAAKTQLEMAVLPFRLRHRAPATADRTIDWFRLDGRTTVQTVSNISLQFAKDTLLYTADYQNWEVEPFPRCTAVGTFPVGSALVTSTIRRPTTA
ncbi:MAG: hypothetical protein NVS2B15_20110 [Pseudarthrobacter sp.]